MQKNPVIAGFSAFHIRFSKSWLHCIRNFRSCRREKRDRSRRNQPPGIHSPKRRRGWMPDIEGYKHYRWSLIRSCNHSSRSIRYNFRHSHRQIRRNCNRDYFRSRRSRHSCNLRRNHNPRNNFFCSFRGLLR